MCLGLQYQYTICVNIVCVCMRDGVDSDYTFVEVLIYSSFVIELGKR